MAKQVNIPAPLYVCFLLTHLEVVSAFRLYAFRKIEMNAARRLLIGDREVPRKDKKR